MSFNINPDRLGTSPHGGAHKLIQEQLENRGKTDFANLGVARPTLKQGGIEVEPVYTKEVEATSTGNTESHRDLCGNTKIEKVGDSDWRVTLSGIITKTQMEKLKNMRPEEDEVRVISDVHNGYVEFDRFTITQNEDLNYGFFYIDGDEITEPLYSFQLQTRDDEEN